MGLEFTVTTALILQPVLSVYIILSVPAVLPITTPVPEPTDALPVPATLLHVPPAGVEFNVVVKPMHTFNVPVIVVGLALTVTTAVAIAAPQKTLVSV